MSIIKFFRTVSEKRSKAAFRELPGLVFDESRWQDPDASNVNITLPEMEQIDISGVPKDYYLSGVLSPRSLDLEEVNLLNERGQFGWYPGIRQGDYSVFGKEYYLHGDDAVYEVMRSSDRAAFPEHGVGVVSRLRLDYEANIYTKVSLGFLKRDLEDLSIDFQESWDQVARFTRKALDGSEISDVNTARNEFLIGNNNYRTIERRIPEAVALQDSWYEINIVTPEGMAESYKPIFSRPDLFLKEMSPNSTRAEINAATFGAYRIRYRSGVIRAKLKQEWVTRSNGNYGRITYRPIHAADLICNRIITTGRTETVSATREVSSGQGVEYYLTVLPVDYINSITVDGVAYSPVEGSLDLAAHREANGLPFAATLEDYKAIIQADDNNHGKTDTIYQLDRMTGVIRFGHETLDVPGKMPDEGAVVVVDYVAAPIVQYDPKGSTMMFYDKEEDLDPLRNSLKQGFVVLDNKRPKPYRITLEAGVELLEVDGSPGIFGPLSIPPVDASDFGRIKARVESRSGEGLPNIPVELFSLDGLSDFSQKTGVTDADGYVYSEAFGKGNFSSFMTAIPLHAPRVAPLEGQPQRPGVADMTRIGDLDPASGHTWATLSPFSREDVDVAQWTNNTLFVDGKFNAAPEDVFVFVTSIPRIVTVRYEIAHLLLGNEPDNAWPAHLVKRVEWTAPDAPGLLEGVGWALLDDKVHTPWDPVRQRGGVTVLWTSISANDFMGNPGGGAHLRPETAAKAVSDNPRIAVHPVKLQYLEGLRQTAIIFNRVLPLPWDRADSEGGVFVAPDICLVTQMVLAIDRTTEIQARTSTAPTLSSNVLSLLLQMNQTMQGQFTLLDPNSPEAIAGTRIDAATFLSVQDPILLIEKVDMIIDGVRRDVLPLVSGVGVDRVAHIMVFRDAATRLVIDAVGADDVSSEPGDAVGEAFRADNDTSSLFTLPSPESNLMTEVIAGGDPAGISEGAERTTTELKLPIFVMIVDESSGKIQKAIKIPQDNVIFTRRTSQSGPHKVEVEVLIPATAGPQADGNAGKAFLSIGGFTPGDHLANRNLLRADYGLTSDRRVSSIPIHFTGNDQDVLDQLD